MGISIKDADPVIPRKLKPLLYPNIKAFRDECSLPLLLSLQYLNIYKMQRRLTILQEQGSTLRYKPPAPIPRPPLFMTVQDHKVVFPQDHLEDRQGESEGLNASEPESPSPIPPFALKDRALASVCPASPAALRLPAARLADSGSFRVSQSMGRKGLQRSSVAQR